MRPSKFSSPRNSPVTMRFENVAGRSSSSAGTNTCAVMMLATCASIAALNGTSSTSRSRSMRMLDQRQLEMRVGARVAVSGKVLAARRDPFGLQRADDGAAEPRDLFGIVRQGAIADDRIPGIGVDVEHRRVVERDADRLQLRGQRPGEPLGQADVAAPAEARHRRPLGERRLQPRDAAAFLIDAHPERQIRHEPGRLVAQLRHLLRLCDVPREENHAAEPELARERPELDGQLPARRIPR